MDEIVLSQLIIETSGKKIKTKRIEIRISEIMIQNWQSNVANLVYYFVAPLEYDSKAKC